MGRTFWLSGLAMGLLLTSGGTLSAQGTNPKPKPPKTHVSTTTHSVKATPPKPPKSFRGIAAKLNTTSEALETQYEAAHTANPKLTHGQFISANVVAHNLGDKYPGVTVQALLDGLKAGKSLGQTLESLKVPTKEANEAVKAADKEIKDAEKGNSPKEPKKP